MVAFARGDPFFNYRKIKPKTWSALPPEREQIDRGTLCTNLNRLGTINCQEDIFAMPVKLKNS